MNPHKEKIIINRNISKIPLQCLFFFHPSCLYFIFICYCYSTSVHIVLLYNMFVLLTDYIRDNNVCCTAEYNIFSNNNMNSVEYCDQKEIMRYIMINYVFIVTTLVSKAILLQLIYIFTHRNILASIMVDMTVNKSFA